MVRMRRTMHFWSPPATLTRERGLNATGGHACLDRAMECVVIASISQYQIVFTQSSIRDSLLGPPEIPEAQCHTRATAAAAGGGRLLGLFFSLPACRSE